MQMLQHGTVQVITLNSVVTYFLDIYEYSEHNFNH